MQYRVAYGDGGFSRTGESAGSIMVIAVVISHRDCADAVMEMNGRRNPDGRLRHRFACWSSDALLRFSSPSVPLATNPGMSATCVRCC